MIASLVAVLVTSSAGIQSTNPPLRLLFLGNSHTYVNNIPGQIEALLETDGKRREVVFDTRYAGFLNDLDTPATHQLIRAGRWDAVVMQGAKVSSSHQFTYSQAGGIALAKTAHEAGSKVLFFVEWPRRGWDESDYQWNVYRGMQKDAGTGELVPVCYSWDNILRIHPNLDLWQFDGNHSSPKGAYLASCVFYYFITGKDAGRPTWKPGEVDVRLAKTMHNVAIETVGALSVRK